MTTLAAWRGHCLAGIASRRGRCDTPRSATASACKPCTAALAPPPAQGARRSLERHCCLAMLNEREALHAVFMLTTWSTVHILCCRYKLTPLH